MILKLSSLFVFLTILPFAWSQRDLTATEAVFIALENNYQIKISERQHEINQKNNRWSEAGLFPTVDLTISQGNTIQDNTNNPFTFTPGVILSQSVNPSLNLNWNLFSGFAVRISKQRLEQLEQQSANNAIAVIETTIQDVLKAYFTAQLQKERTELFGSILSLSRERYNYYKVKEKYSSSSSLESLQFRNQYLTDSTNHLLQEISYENALRNLQLLMNESETEADLTKYNLTDSMDVVIKTIDFSEAQNDMLANNQNLKNQYISLELQQTNTELSKSFLYPTLSFQAGVQPSWSWLRDLTNTGTQFKTQNLSYYGNFNLRYTLFNNWKNKRAIEVSRIQEDISSLNIENMKRTLSNTLKNLIEIYKVRVQLVDISTENLVYSEKAFELAQRRFSNGSINSIDLSNFQNNYQNTLVQHYENQFNRLDTYLEIYKMTGKISLEYKK